MNKLYILFAVILFTTGCNTKDDNTQSVSTASNTPIGDYGNYEVFGDFVNDKTCIIDVFITDDGDYNATMTADEIMKKNAGQYSSVYIYMYTRKKKDDNHLFYKVEYCNGCSNALMVRDHKGFWSKLKSYR